MRKVKFTQDTFEEKLGAILTEFPMLDVRENPIFVRSWLMLYFVVTGPPPILILFVECVV